MKLLRLWIFPFIGRGVDSLLWSRYYEWEKCNKGQRMEKSLQLYAGKVK